MSSQSIYEKIEAYLEGKLTEEERKAFEAQLASDPKLAEKVSLYKNIDQVIEDQSTLDFQKLVQEQGTIFLQNEQKETAGEQSPIRFLSRRSLLIAASLLILVISIVLIYQNVNNQDKLSGPELYAHNFDTYNLNQSLRSQVSRLTDFQNGIKAYQSQDYDLAVNIFEDLAQNDSDDIVLAYCLAQAYLNQQPAQFAKAKASLRKIIVEGGSIYVPKAKWYLALIHLQEEALVEAKNLLEEVAQSDDQFGAKAKQVLGQLD